ncbi:NlpC/P60 family protein [Streptomyces sp. NPDC020983]|uniref:C40 family peptidase n=1 Tax=Streptomyces sp. NPDC020983 TaxID=3365106 RepID=UPI00379D88FB
MASHSPAGSPTGSPDGPGAHRRRPPSAGGPASATKRVGVTLALASAASVSLLGETAHAEPRLTPDQVRAQVAALYQQAEQATQDYDGAKERADSANAAVTALQDELARKTAALNTTRDALGSLAAAQYRTGGIDPLLQLALSSSPGTYLERAAFLAQAGGVQSVTLHQLAAQQRDIAGTRAQATGRLAALRTAQAAVADHRHTVARKLAAAQALLAGLTAAQRTALTADDGPAAESSGAPAASRGDGRPSLPAVAAPSPRAARAVAFAFRALGLPYVWGATGPRAYDCSGLTQAAWKAAGVTLPRTTYTQINAGTRVPRGRLQPGDLVFFYSGVSHVGIYIGAGKMIHAPHPGSTVRIAPISEMPFAGAVRPS